MTESHQALSQLRHEMLNILSVAQKHDMVLDVIHTTQVRVTRWGSHLIRMIAPQGCECLTLRTTDGSAAFVTIRADSLNCADPLWVSEVRDSSL